MTAMAARPGAAARPANRTVSAARTTQRAPAPTQTATRQPARTAGGVQPEGRAPILLNQAASGGGWDANVEANITDAMFTEWDYAGKGPLIFALAVQFETDDGNQHDQYYSCGDTAMKNFVISDDGGMLIPVADKQLLEDQSNAWKFLESCLQAGLEIQTSCKEIVGARVFAGSHAQPKRQGLIRGNEDERQKTIVLVDQLLAAPGEQAEASKGKAAQRPIPQRTSASTQASRAGTTAAPANARNVMSRSKPNGADTEDASEKALAADVLLGILAEAGGQVEKKSLATTAFRAAGAKVQAGEMDAKQKTKVVQLVFQDAFLHELVEQGQIVYDGATVGLPE
jgi:hypothetical protein